MAATKKKKEINLSYGELRAKKNINGDISTLIDHSNGVNKLAFAILNNYEFSETFKKEQEVVLNYSTLLHDIGKATNNFQTKLANIEVTENFDAEILDDNDKSIDTEKITSTHAQIGAAFVLMHLKEYKKIGLTIERIENIVSNIYWHHGITPWQHSNGNDQNSLDTIYRSIDKETIKKMVILANELTGQNLFVNQPFENRRNYEKLPAYINLNLSKSNNLIIGSDKLNIVTRSLLVLADRLYSELEFSGLSVDDMLKIYTNKSNIYKEKIKSTYDGIDKVRFTKQKNIAKETGTLFINAPTGMGKTMIGYLFANNNQKKTIWVNPKNIVARAVYDNLINHINDMGTKHKVQLYLSGQVEKQNYDGNDAADILITNIDNFLAPTTKNNLNHSLFSLFSNDTTIIFDEYHDLMAESAYSSLFIHLVKLRSEIMTGTNTMLLSATHSGLIETIFPKNSYRSKELPPYKVLPNTNEHYNAAHNKKYKINLIDYEEKQQIDIMLERGAILYTNTVKETQAAFMLNNPEFKSGAINDSIIYHSSFISEQKSKIFNHLQTVFSKDNAQKVKKERVFASMIAQASIDMSFNLMYDTAFSIEATFQRMGRLNRWGEHEEATINILNTHTKSNNAIVDLIYSNELRKLWINYIREHLNGKSFTLDELYVHYNNYYKQKDVQIALNRFLLTGKGNMGIIRTSLNYLAKVFPVRYPNSKKIEEAIKVYSADGNPIRTTGYKHYFFTCKFDKRESTYNPDCPYVPVAFNAELYGNNREELKESNIESELFNAYGIIMSNRDVYSMFEYQEQVHLNKYNKADKWFKAAKKSNSPYIRTDIVYNSILGLIYNDNDLKNNMETY